MRRAQPFIAVLFILAVIAVPCRAFAFFGAEAAVGVWNQTPSGTMSDQKILPADDLDLKDDLNLGSETRLFARVKVELPLVLPNVYFMATPMSFQGTGSKNANFSFNGQQFDANVAIDSKVKLDHYDLALYYPIPLLKTATAGILNVELGLNARQIAFEGAISSLGQNRSTSKTLTLYVPMIYAGVQVKPIPLIGVEAELRGVAYGSNSYTDFIGRVKLHPIPLLFVAAGYRAETLKIDVKDVQADISFSGPFAEVGVSF